MILSNQSDILAKIKNFRDNDHPALKNKDVDELLADIEILLTFGIINLQDKDILVFKGSLPKSFTDKIQQTIYDELGIVVSIISTNAELVGILRNGELHGNEAIL